MISASHNPYEDNGIKLFGPDGYKLSDQVEAKIETMLAKDFALKLSKPADLGRATRVEGDRARYIEFAKRTLFRNLALEGLRIVVDCANGAAYKVAPEALWELGAEVISIGVEPDGFNINRGVGSTAPQALIKKVREVRADIGVALDGDADRVTISSWRPWRRAGRTMGDWRSRAFATVMSNLGLERYLDSVGLSLARTPVGDRYVLGDGESRPASVADKGLHNRASLMRPMTNRPIEAGRSA